MCFHLKGKSRDIGLPQHQSTLPVEDAVVRSAWQYIKGRSLSNAAMKMLQDEASPAVLFKMFMINTIIRAGDALEPYL